MKLFTTTFSVSLWLAAGCALLLGGCLSLQSVHHFSAEALQSTEKFGEIELSFQKLCEEKTMMQAVRTAAVRRSYRGGCELQLLADSSVFKMQQALVDYLTGLQLLTADQRIHFVLDPLGRAVQENTLLRWEEQEVQAYQQLASLMLMAATEAYRKKKVADFIAQAHAPVSLLLEKLVFVMHEVLREAVEQQQEMRYLQTRELADSARSFLEKRELILGYAREVAYYEQQLQLLDAYVAMLQSIQQGHQQLYEQREQLDQEDALHTLMYYTGEIRLLHTAFEKIK